MNTAHAPAPPFRGQRRKRQRGASMFVVMAVLLLALVLTLGGLAVANLNEALVGNQSDAQRAYNAAQALVSAAQHDIRLNGRRCNAALMGGGGANPDFGNAACTQRFPRDMDEYMELVTGGKIAKSRCADPGTAEKFVGVCIPAGPADARFSGQTSGGAAGDNAQQWDNGAGYGNDFIKVLDGSQAVPYGGGARSGDGCCALAAQGRYWVEVFPYNAASVAIAGMGRAPVPDNAYPFVFRITAVARGIKGGTVSALRTYYTPFPMRAAP